MKSLLLSLSLLPVLTVESRDKTFTRIFDSHGKTIHKGYLIKVSDSSLILSLSKNETTYEIPVSKITLIKLRRPFGRTVLLSSLIVGVPLAVLGSVASTDGTDEFISISPVGGALIGFVFGAALGAVTGSIIAGTRNRPKFNVNMNQEQWMKVKPVLESYLPAK